jgi:hypothetical protein
MQGNPPSGRFFKETTTFKSWAKKNLSLNELKGLKFVLADNPFAGYPSGEGDGLYFIEWGKNKLISYLISEDLITIWLVSGDSDEIKPNKSESTTDTQIKTLLRAIVGGGGFYMGRKFLEWLFGKPL